MKNLKLLVIVFCFIFSTVGTFFSDLSKSRAQSIQDWSDPINLSNSGAALNPLLVVDRKGELHVLWVDQFDGYKYASSPDASKWASPETVKFPFSPEDSLPVFIVDPNGFIHIFWRTKGNVLRYGKTTPENFDAPSAWSEVITLDTSVYDFDVVLDSESTFHVDYIRDPIPATDPAGVYYRQSKDGSFWSATTLLYASQYFRSIDPADAHVRIEASNGNEKRVYAVWDDRSQKRIFMASLEDSGTRWSTPKEIILPESSLGFKTPFNIEIGNLNNNILLMWQVGDPRIRCSLLSQWSTDGGENWAEPIKIFDEFTSCPEKSEFLFANQDYLMALLKIQGDLSLIAWNGTGWSNPESQSGLSAMSNPKTFDPIIFWCQQVSYFNNRLFVVGCDQGGSGDIWFSSRSLDPADILFPQPSGWDIAKDVAVVPQQITSLSSVADRENNVHSLWVQSASSELDSYEPRIQYARWNGEDWSLSASVITDLSGLPVQLSVTMDSQQRLLLSWINESSGEIMFGWANSSGANIPSEWKMPIILPSPSSLNNSPDILVDASNYIMVVYAVTMNEERGIYLVHSNDLGETWSSPIKVFDAVSAGWDSVDQPKLALTGDGRLHVLFTRFSALGGRKPSGLYYSQSSDGGITWSDPKAVSEQNVLWSEIVGDNGQVIHRLWQEKDRSVAFVYHQISRDGGMTWESPIKISNVDGTVPKLALSMTGSGNLHLIQLIPNDIPLLEEWEWSGVRWRALEDRKLNVKDQSIPVSVHAGITSEGMLSALLLFDRDDLVDGHSSQLLNINRSLELAETAQFLSTTSIATPVFQSAPTNVPDLQPTPTQISPLANLDEPSSKNKNAIGLVLVAAVIVALLIFIIPSRKK